MEELERWITGVCPPHVISVFLHSVTAGDYMGYW